MNGAEHAVERWHLPGFHQESEFGSGNDRGPRVNGLCILSPSNLDEQRLPLEGT